MIITIANQKGGAGKTTTAAALAQAGAEKGKRILAIDADSQGNLTAITGADPAAGNSYDLITGRAAAGDVIQTVEQGFDVIAAAFDLASLRAGKGSAWRLVNALQPVKTSYDIIIIDAPTAPGEIQINCLMAADGLIIPTEADPSSIQGVYMTADTAAQIQNAHALEILGVMVTRYDGRSSYNKAMQGKAQQAAADINAPYLGEIRQGAKIKEAQGLQLNVYQYAPKSNPASDYMQLFEQLFD